MDFNNTGAMKSPFSPRVRQSISGRRPIGLSSGKKNQSFSKFNQTMEEQGGEVVYKTPSISLETFGAPLPVMVTEALTFASGDVSVRLSACGWCWLVSGRRVLAWPYTASSGDSATSPAARELTLPQTDLAHKADLVMLFYEDGAQMPSCIGVSPEGVVRYWASVGQEGAYVDVSCELAGQECERVCGSGAPLLLATTTCTLVALAPAIVDGRATVSCRTLRPPSGWLGGLGRRVSLLFFGTMPAHADTKLVGVVVLGDGGLEPDGTGCVALVGAAGGGEGPVLQVWRGAALHEHPLRRALAVHSLAPHGDLASLEIQALDVRAGGDCGLLLLVAAGGARAPDLRLAIAHVSLEDAGCPRVTSLLPLRGAPPADDPPRFLPLPPHVLLYTHNYIVLASSGGGGDAAEYVDVGAARDRLLGGELCGGALLFSAQHGALRARVHAAPPPPQPPPPHRSMCESPLGSPCPSDVYDGNLSLYEIDPHEISAITVDACGKLKTAFLFHLRREAGACRALLLELFPAGGEEDVDHVLDRTVLAVAAELVDDMPAGDPRWRPAPGAAPRLALGSSAALQVAAQLHDKKLAFTLFVDFLRAAGLWRRLRRVSQGEEVVRTTSALSALAELLAGAAALRGLQHGAHAHLVLAAAYQAVSREEEEAAVAAALASGALSAADVAFRRVSRLPRLLAALCARAPPAPAPCRDTLTVINTVLAEMSAARAAFGVRVDTPPAHVRALLPALLDLHTLALTRSVRECREAGLRAQLLEAAAALADHVLAEAAPLPVYRQLRRDLIQPYIEEGQLERAAVLAEKFKEFELLIEMCVRHDQPERLYSYIDKYAHEGMCEMVFSWAGDRGGAAWAALIRGAGSRYSARFLGWLRAAHRGQLAAAAALHARRHRDAAAALAALAAEETRSLQRMTTMASLAKLCLLAAEDEEEEEEEEGGGAGAVRRAVEARLALGEQHAALPRDIRLHRGLDAADMRVHAPEDLVQMYVECDSGSLTEYDYKKALDLTEYVHDMERRDDLRLRVWCACLRRDTWHDVSADAPRDAARHKLFFRLLDLVHLMGGDVELLLPPLEDVLTAPELAELLTDRKFHYILKYAYECVDASAD